MVVYLITNNINGKKYVGQTSCDIKTRLAQHIAEVKRGSSQLIHKAIRKYGANHFDIRELQQCSSYEEMDEVEGYYIKKLNTFMPNGYNMTPGGKSGRTGYTHTEKFKRQRSVQYTGKGNPNFGKRYVETSKFAGFKGKTHSTKTKKLISEKMKGRIITQETREKIRAANLGRKDNRGESISLARGRKVIHIPTNVVYNSAGRASLSTGVTVERVLKSCKGKTSRGFKDAKTAAAFEFRFYDEYTAILSQCPKGKGATTIETVSI